MGASVRKQAKELGIPWEDNCPAQISDWLLASILPNAASLMGQSTIKVGYKIKAESINLFLICLCDPRAGKSPAFHHGCAQPVRLHVEAREDIPLFEDEFKATPGHNAIIGKEEATQLFGQLLGGSREKSRIDLERLIQLYDGNPVGVHKWRQDSMPGHRQSRGVIEWIWSAQPIFPHLC